MDESSIGESAREKESQNNERGVTKKRKIKRMGTEPNVRGRGGSSHFDVFSSLFKIGTNIKI